ncbi:MAG: hypothetical protein H6Q16_274 [Bacteroidetes bacterium]|nr:hypothetical protein [Bacteroidota bacterium]
MNIFTQKNKLLHNFKKKNEYSIHSPYMFDLYNRIIKKHKRNPLKLIHLFQEEFGKEDIIIISSSYDEFKTIQTIVKDSSIIIIDKPYQSKYSYNEFLKIISDPRRIVSIDLFKIGIIFQNSKLSPQEYRF